MTDDEIIAVVTAKKEGKKIQSWCLLYDKEWHDTEALQWNFAVYDYRVKPEPVELEAWFFNGKYQFSTLGMSELDKNFYLQSGYKYKKMREVIE